MALEWSENGSSCGMVTNPLGYMYMAKQPGSPLINMHEGSLRDRSLALGQHIAQRLGVGKGCDSSDDEESARWGC